jgi:NADPH-dependent glutamate synthase beta subunit-like oxidoreductase
LNIQGEEFQGVFPGVEFLRDINLGKKFELGRKVAVIGGGNVAVDVARSALRLGAKRVEIYYRRSRKEMPAISEEVEEAIREGVKIHLLTSPLKIVGKGGKGVGMDCVRMKLGEPDKTGRRKPIPVEGSNFKVQADTIISAIGQRVDRRILTGLETNPDGTVRVHSETSETSMKGLFAGGDVVTGPGWAIEAIAAGKKGAQSIHRYLS